MTIQPSSQPNDQPAADAHYSVNFEENDEGWYVPECQCGWTWAPVPDAETAADALMEHAYVQGVRDHKKGRARV